MLREIISDIGRGIVMSPLFIGVLATGWLASQLVDFSTVLVIP